MPRDGMSQRPGTLRIDERCCWPRSVVAPLGEPSQQLRAQLATSAGASRLNVDRDTGLSGALEGDQALQRLPIRKTDDLIISLEDEPFVGGAKPMAALCCRERPACRRHIVARWLIDFSNLVRMLEKTLLAMYPRQPCS
jgi:hypothetical protein